MEGKPNQLYSQGMRSFEKYDEICKYFAEGKNPNEIQKHLQLHNVSVGEYLTDRYALWLDFRMIDEKTLHRTGRRIENASEGNHPADREERRITWGSQCLHLPNYGCSVEHPVWHIRFCYILE